MNTAALEALIEKWERKCRNPETQDDSEEAALRNARDDGYRLGVAECTDQLKTLVNLLGE